MSEDFCFYEEYGQALSCYERALFFSTSLEDAKRATEKAISVARQTGNAAQKTKDNADLQLKTKCNNQADPLKKARETFSTSKEALKDAVKEKSDASEKLKDLDIPQGIVRAKVRVAIINGVAGGIHVCRRLEAGLIRIGNLHTHLKWILQWAEKIRRYTENINDKKVKADDKLQKLIIDIQSYNAAITKCASATNNVNEKVEQRAHAQKELLTTIHILKDIRYHNNLLKSSEKIQADASTALTAINAAGGGLPKRYYDFEKLGKDGIPTVQDLCLEITNIYMYANLLLSIRLNEITRRGITLLDALSSPNLLQQFLGKFPVTKSLLILSGRAALSEAMWPDRNRESVAPTREIVFKAFKNLYKNTVSKAQAIKSDDESPKIQCARNWKGLENICRLYMDEIEHLSGRINHMTGLLHTRQSLRNAAIGIMISVIGLCITFGKAVQPQLKEPPPSSPLNATTNVIPVAPDTSGRTNGSPLPPDKIHNTNGSTDHS